MQLIQIIFGWPGMILAMVLAIAGIFLRKRSLLLIAAVVILPSSLYFFGGNNWVRYAAIYIPVSVLGSAFFIRKSRVIPALLICPVIVFYLWLGYFVATQETGPGRPASMTSPPVRN